MCELVFKINIYGITEKHEFINPRLELKKSTLHSSINLLHSNNIALIGEQFTGLV